jgi:TolB-like protein/class 3 adenylate cyclase/tetratricopeptide (TPR) repeat protein
MTDERTRQLAAVMFVDMVGYTALMQEDEELAWSQRDRHREVLSELIPGHQGQILQYFGDGTLSVFSSAVKAVECAIAIQLELRTAPEVPVRIGIHTGDIVQDQDGVYGDGVNVASRVESLAPAGSVLISGKVFDEIKNHSTIAASSLGRYRLKNVKAPVEIFTITNEGLAAATEEDVRSRLADPSPGPSGDIPEVPPLPADAGVGERFIAAVKERAIIQWGLTYLAGAWVVLQVVGFAGQQFGWPSFFQRGLGLLAFVGFFVAMVVTWFHGARGRQRITGPEVLLVAGLLVVAGLALTTLDPSGTPPSDLMGGFQVESPADPRPSIAVLPFDNFSPNPEDEYFANGVQEDITSALSRIRTLRVPGRSSVEQYRDSRPGTREIADALGADYLLEGSARVVSGTVRITVQLIDGRTDQHVWTEDYDRSFSVEEVIGIQSEVAETVAEELRAVITPAEAARISALPTESPEAFVLYHRARHRWNRRTEPDVQAAMGLYQEAIRLDSRFAAAYAGLADAFLVLANWGWSHPRDAYPSALSAAEAALELDSMEANTHATLGGLYLWYKQDWAASEAMFRRAIELDPDHAYAHYWYSVLLSAVGRHDEAIHLARQAAEMDPLAHPIVYGVGRSLFIAREFDEAEAEVRMALDRHTDYGNLHLLLCNVLIAADKLAAAEDACVARNGIEGTESSLSLAILRARQGNPEEALEQLDETSAVRGEAGRQPVIEAMVFAALGDVDGAFERLRFAIDEGYPHTEYVLTHPFMDPLRDDSRFDGILRDVGF